MYMALCKLFEFLFCSNTADKCFDRDQKNRYMNNDLVTCFEIVLCANHIYHQITVNLYLLPKLYQSMKNRIIHLANYYCIDLNSSGNYTTTTFF